MAPSGLSCSNPLSQEELTTLRWFPALNALPFHERLIILSKAKRGAVNWRRVNFGTQGLDRMETAAIQSLMANGFPMHGRGHFRHDPEDRLIVWLMEVLALDQWHGEPFGRQWIGDWLRWRSPFSDFDPLSATILGKVRADGEWSNKRRNNFYWYFGVDEKWHYQLLPGFRLGEPCADPGNTIVEIRNCRAIMDRVSTVTISEEDDNKSLESV